jgi:hypothetical protein
MAGDKKEAEIYFSALESWALLFILIGIIPWSVYCFNTLLPALGITRIKLGILIAIILAPAILLFGAVRLLAKTLGLHQK